MTVRTVLVYASNMMDLRRGRERRSAPLGMIGRFEKLTPRAELHREVSPGRLSAVVEIVRRAFLSSGSSPPAPGTTYSQDTVAARLTGSARAAAPKPSAHDGVPARG